MSAHLVALPGRKSRGPEAKQELCVLIACHQLLCAVPVRWIERLVLPDEVAVVVSPSGTQAAVPIVLVGEREYASWNLGTMLALSALENAWLLMRVPHKGRELAIALQTGSCLVVQHLTPGVPLPASVFRARPGVVASAFSTQSVNSRWIDSPVALWLDPARLWTDEELDAAAAALAAARQD